MGNLFWGMQFRTCEKFRAFADSKSSLTPEIFHKYKSHTAITSIAILRLAQNLIKNHAKIAESALDSANLHKKFLLLLAFAKSRISLISTGSNPPSRVDSAFSQNLIKNAESNAKSTQDAPKNKL